MEDERHQYRKQHKPDFDSGASGSVPSSESDKAHENDEYGEFVEFLEKPRKPIKEKKLERHSKLDWLVDGIVAARLECLEE